MRNNAVTLLSPPAPGPVRSLTGSLPPDLLEQVRRRVAAIALLLAIAFAFDPLMWLGAKLAATLGADIPPAVPGDTVGFQVVNATAALASLVLWRAARGRRWSNEQLHTLGLCYEVAICLTIGLLAHWRYYLAYRMLPPLTWIPAIVIFFPLILPGPPRRMLAAAVASAGMGPLSILLLQELAGLSFPSVLEAYAPAFVASGFAVGFAWLGSRVVYGLGREVVAARELGSYQLEERLGQGGMGEVWRARHRLLARPAAVKVIRPVLTASPEALRRFEREAQAIAALRSPHTVNLFDFGVASDGAFYYVMELLDGLDTDRLVREHGPQPAERVVHVIRQVCHSLSEAESRGLVHRDIKPANIFLCRYGEDHDFVKVLDFGIVKSLADAPESGAGLTRESTVPGSPEFMAPEQAMGEATVDGRADIYATGCVAYWLLTGKTVFAGDSPVGQLMSHASAPPERPSARTGHPIPGELEAVIMRCLAKDPSARPPTARALADELARVPCPSPWLPERAADWWRVAGGGSYGRPTPS